MSELCLSICIPTNGRINILKNTLDSIYNDCKVPFSKFEVVLSDNSKNNDLLVLLQSYKQFPNIVYQKTDCDGFLNSINALKTGKGLLLKLHNNYTMFSKYGLEEIIAFIDIEKTNKPLIFFKNFGREKIKSYNSFDIFNYDLSFWNSWSSGFSIWKEDFDQISNLEVNKMFPHTSLFLNQHYKKEFIINDIVYFINQEVPGKGGYDLFRTFAVDYLKMIEEVQHEGYINPKTFIKIKKDLFFDFLVVWYRNTKIAKNDYTFQLKNIKKSINIYYKNSYYKLIFFGYIVDFKFKIKALINLMKIKPFQ